MGSTTKIFLIVIPLVSLFILGLIYFGPSGALDKLKGSAESLKDYVPDVSIGADQLTAKEAGISAEHQQALSTLKTNLEKITKSSGPCFAYYTTAGGLPELKEQGTSITFSYDSNKDETTIITYGGAGGKQIVTDLSFTIPKMKLCVIAGTEEVTSTFAGVYLNTLLWEEKIKKDLSKTYQLVNNIKIIYHPCTLLKSANHIEVPELGIGIDHNECNNLQDYGIIYTPDGSHICFFPTVYGGNDKDGLNNDYLGESPFDAISIPKQLNEGKLKKCFEASEVISNDPALDLPGDTS